MMQTQQTEIAILMATYNGARFLAEQLDSILRQSFTNWHLYISDDGSTDDTLAIARTYAARDARITVLDATGRNRGATMNFMQLLERIDAPYYMFADQDDVWLPGKIELSFARLLEVEAGNGERPAAVHTDLKVVNERLEEINPSLWDMLRIEPSLLTTVESLGAHCLMTGCTMIFNRAAKGVSFPVAKTARVHDMWMTLCILHAGGVIGEVRRATILYRQHERNTVGAKNFQVNYISNKFRNIGVVIRENREHYRMLCEKAYGSWTKYLLSKVKYYFEYNKYIKSRKEA